MESIYYVLCWHCHRRCKHCYESKFHPYVREELEAVVSEAERNSPLIIANFPDTMIFDDWRNPDADGKPVKRRGRIILSGGDVLTDPVRERVLYPTIKTIVAKYAAHGGVNVVVQTTGDLVTPAIIQELLNLGVWMISIAGLDDYHVGMKGEGKVELEAALRHNFEAAGMHQSGLKSAERLWIDEEGPVFSAFGATEDAWIGKLWPRGRAWKNSLSKATLTDNFCNAWSGGLNFLEHGRSGSEVSVDPSGDLYPCCIKTAEPLANLTEEKLIDVLNALAGHPALEAINAGKPERMALDSGWSVDDFIAASRTKAPDGSDYENLCIGCDRCFTAVVGPVLKGLRRERLGKGQTLFAVESGDQTSRSA